MSNELEEYKGYFLALGVTMPSYGIHQWDIYKSRADYEAEKPVTTAESLDEAKRWVDEHAASPGVEEADEAHQKEVNLVELRGLANAIDATDVKERIAQNLKDIESLARKWRKELG